MTARLENETFFDYRMRRKMEQEADAEKVAGIKTVDDHVLNREKFRILVAKAKKELKIARSHGYSDQQVLDALREGDEGQKKYADFIEFNILKAG